MLKSILEVGRQMEDCMPVKEVILLSCPDVSVDLWSPAWEGQWEGSPPLTAGGELGVRVVWQAARVVVWENPPSSSQTS